MAKAKVVEYPVIWFQAASCTGCSVSVLNSVSPTIKNVLIDEVIPGKHLNLKFQATIKEFSYMLEVRHISRIYFNLTYLQV